MPHPPELKICVREGTGEKQRLTIPNNLRQKWLKCPIRSYLVERSVFLH